MIQMQLLTRKSVECVSVRLSQDHGSRVDLISYRYF